MPNYCPNCGAPWAPGARFCSGCGQPADEAVGGPPYQSVEIHSSQPGLGSAIGQGFGWSAGCLLFLVTLAVMFVWIVSGVGR